MNCHNPCERQRSRVTMNKIILKIIIVCVIHFPGYAAQDCPDEATDLKKWSEPDSWPNKKVPAKDDNVTIEDRILLDVTPPPLKSILIQPNGMLVWKDLRDADDKYINLTVNYIHIKGQMHIGGPDCKYLGKTHITLTGDKEEYDISGFNEKFIGVDEGGTLELHGGFKLPWTKITKTIKGLTRENGLIADEKNAPDVRTADGGLVAYVFNQNTGVLEQSKFLFNKMNSSERKADEAARDIQEFLRTISNGKIVGIGMKRRLTAGDVSNLDSVFDVLQEFLYGTTDHKMILRNYVFHDAYAVITEVGNASSTDEMLVKNTGVELERTAEVCLIRNGIKFTQRSWVHTINRGICYVRATATFTNVSMPVVDVADDVGSWKTGDKVVVASSDFNWEQAEIGTVLDCDSCKVKQVKLNLNPVFDHFGEIHKNVDMRAEIGLLTRNIMIEGGPATKSKHFGGHIKFLKGFKNVHIQNVELSKMGQYTALGRYPLHFHMCEDVDKLDNPPYLRGNSIHHTFARCITIHGTHGVLVEDNVCYNTFGHGYFLEDGGEKRTVFNGNLGLGQRRPERDLKKPRGPEESEVLDDLKFLIHSDREPSTFWITNPLTTMTNNVAAGCDNTGIWYIFPDEPLGPSSSKDFMQKDEAKHTLIHKFYNNVAHSNVVSGLTFDKRIDKDGKAFGHNEYDPWNDPLDSSSGRAVLRFEKLTAYKNMLQNAWIRSEDTEVVSSSFSDSTQNLVFARNRNQKENKAAQYLKESVMLGVSPNKGKETVKSLAQWGTTKDVDTTSLLNTPRQGFVFYFGPVFVQDSWFSHFTPTTNYTAGALGFFRNNPGFSSPNSAVKGLKFGFTDPPDASTQTLTGNRVFDGEVKDSGFSDQDGDDVATFRDVDGSVTTVNGTTVLKPNQFHMTPYCKVRSNWKMAVCPHKYAQLDVQMPKAKFVFMKRTDKQDALMMSDTASKGAPFLTILGERFVYILYSNESANSVTIYGKGVTKSLNVPVGICIPDGMKLKNLKSPPLELWGIKKWEEVHSLDAVLDDTTGKKYFNDTSNSIIFVNFQNSKNFEEAEHTDCPGFQCAKLTVEFESDTESKGPSCNRNFFHSAYNSASKVDFGDMLPVDVPPRKWGAGSTRPFTVK